MESRYPGVHPHLNSRLQGGGWGMFHSSFIDKLGDALDALLPEGYYAFTEESLQISLTDPDTGEELASRRSVPAAIITREGETLPPSDVAASVAVPTLVLPVAETLDEDVTLNSIVVYRIEGRNLPGEPVTRFEVLSPGNKPGGAHYPHYVVTRRQTLTAGLRLVEIDLLHETRPVMQGIPSYADREPDAYPYMIVVSDPRPALLEGRSYVYGWRVRDPLPVVAIPLAGDDRATLDFVPVYRQTLAARRGFALRGDATRPPDRFDTYDEIDRATITRRMADAP